MSDYVVWRSDIIESLREARRYYEERLAGMHVVKCHGRETTLFFQSDTNHTYTEEPPEDRDGVSIIKTRLKGGVIEERVFCLDRACLLDRVIPAVALHSYAMKGEGLVVHQDGLFMGRNWTTIHMAGSHFVG